MRSTRHRTRGQTTLRHVLIGAAVLLALLAASLTERWWSGEPAMPATSPAVAATVSAAPVVSVAHSGAATVAAPAPVPAPVVVASPPPKTAEQRAADAAAEAAREADWVETRREAIRIQQRLRAEANAQKAREQQPASQGETRCVDGQKMRRVENGWVQDGKC